MEEILYDALPSLDLTDFYFNDPLKKQKFVNGIGTAFNIIGFVSIRNHFLPSISQNKLYDSIKKFFALPNHVKQIYERPHLANQRGYTGRAKEHAIGRNVGDLKEFYHVGQEIKHQVLSDENYPPNVWPIEVPDFEQNAVAVYQSLEKTGALLLQAIALYLQLPENYFEDKIRNGNSILRPIHYYPIENRELVPSDAVRAAEHGDINLITLLMGASADGLQVLRRDGEWISITALPDQLVVNVGDMLERLTNRKLKSTIHRVVNPPKEFMNTPRYSIPFFMHPRAEMDLTCLESCIDDHNPKLFKNITAGEFLNQRLTEIGLRK